MHSFTGTFAKLVSNITPYKFFFFSAASKNNYNKLHIRYILFLLFKCVHIHVYSDFYHSSSNGPLAKLVSNITSFWFFCFAAASRNHYNKLYIRCILFLLFNCVHIHVYLDFYHSSSNGPLAKLVSNITSHEYRSSLLHINMTDVKI